MTLITPLFGSLWSIFCCVNASMCANGLPSMPRKADAGPGRPHHPKENEFQLPGDNCLLPARKGSGPQLLRPTMEAIVSTQTHPPGRPCYHCELRARSPHMYPRAAPGWSAETSFVLASSAWRDVVNDLSEPLSTRETNVSIVAQLIVAAISTIVLIYTAVGSCRIALVRGITSS